MNEIALDPIYEQRAVERRDALRGLYGHASSYIVVNAGLVVVNLLTSPDYLWVVWSLFGWGIGLGSHAIGVLSGAVGRPDMGGVSPTPSLPSTQMPWVQASPAHPGVGLCGGRTARPRTARQRARRPTSSGMGLADSPRRDTDAFV